MTRSEHLTWAKERALKELDAPGRDAGEAIAQALTSMTSDLSKHSGTWDHIGPNVAVAEILAGTIKTVEQMRKHIEGYN